MSNRIDAVDLLRASETISDDVMLHSANAGSFVISMKDLRALLFEYAQGGLNRTLTRLQTLGEVQSMLDKDYSAIMDLLQQDLPNGTRILLKAEAKKLKKLMSRLGALAPPVEEDPIPEVIVQFGGQWRSHCITSEDLMTPRTSPKNTPQWIETPEGLDKPPADLEPHELVWLFLRDGSIISRVVADVTWEHGPPESKDVLLYCRPIKF